MSNFWVQAGAAAASLLLIPKAIQRIRLSRAKHRSLAGHSLMSKRLARLIPPLNYSEQAWWGVDGAPQTVQWQRQAGLTQLTQSLARKSPLSISATEHLKPALADLNFVSRYRVPFPFAESVSHLLSVGSVWREASDNQLVDLDGHHFWDVTGSFGVNVFGLDFYKPLMRASCQDALAVGPMLGGYTADLESVVDGLRRHSGMDEVSFHMSGTEAVMQAVRLARYHTRRKKIVRFAGAYHGWWDDVQPGVGNPMPPGHVFTLEEMSEKTLQVIRSRKDIACVLVNPLQAMHVNQNAPSDSALIAGERRIRFDREAYTRWLQALRQACSEAGVALIMDEVFMGFRLGKRGAQGYFDVQADLVCYGKTIAGGWPVGVVCGKDGWMQRYHPERPADICFARGTFNAHPAVIAGIKHFLLAIDTPEITQLYRDADRTWQQALDEWNARFEREDIPIRVAGLQTIWGFEFLVPSRYHWLLQFYLRDAGIAMSWVGTGRLIFNLSYTEAQRRAVLDAVVQAYRAFESHQWPWLPEGATAKDLKRAFSKDLLVAKWHQWCRFR